MSVAKVPVKDNAQLLRQQLEAFYQGKELTMPPLARREAIAQEAAEYLMNVDHLRGSRRAKDHR